MKRIFSLFDAVFVLFLYFKLSETLALSWITVFSPFVIEWSLQFVGALDKTFGWSAWVNYRFWKLALKWRVDRATKQARREMKKH